MLLIRNADRIGSAFPDHFSDSADLTVDQGEDLSSSNDIDITEAAAVPVPPAKQPIVIVLGMHRSGTSLCSHILSALGVDMADDVGHGPANVDGHWERWELVDLHDRLLLALERPYNNPRGYELRHDLPLPRGWRALPVAHAVRRDIETFLKERMYPGQLFGFKDPRTCRLLPLWMEIIERLDLEPRFVICVRDPIDVALSLKRRDDLPVAAGEYRWLTYNADCFRHVRDGALLVTYESWFNEPQRTIERLRDFVMPEVRKPIPPDVFDLIQPELNHGVSKTRSGAGSSVVSDLYGALKALEADPSRWPAVDAAIAFFDLCQANNPYGEALMGALSRDEESRLRIEEERDAAALARADVERLTADLHYARSRLAVTDDTERMLRLALEEAREEKDVLKRQLDRALSLSGMTEGATPLVAMPGTADALTVLHDGAGLSEDVARLLRSADLRIRRLERSMGARHDSTPQEGEGIDPVMRGLTSAQIDMMARSIFDLEYYQAGTGTPETDPDKLWMEFIGRGWDVEMSGNRFFDVRYYRFMSGSIDEASSPTPLHHYAELGLPRQISPSWIFDEAYYLHHNPDVAAAIERGELVCAFEHFSRSGTVEGRNGCPFFNERRYLELNPDIAEAVAAGALRSGESHYLQYGQKEGRLFR
ncbi:hypothetical protein FO470_15260 [Starkeya sp. 3C]|uniref:Sulfotransferase family protein n=1 Tax=Ancylobacter moscoviensis TaxID=2597768 RepID=A0ABY3DNT1_9HYPH|nr:sulfotransferase [Ancylobacter moscoviensis]TSJ60916.1 hypothetical protein FO470_15260 [Ancylobacter moscoviensis]